MKLIMVERHKGTVEHVADDSVTVVYWINDGPVEQQYVKSQFMGGELPKLGQVITVDVAMYEEDPPEPPPYDPAEDDKPTNRKPLTGPEVL